MDDCMFDCKRISPTSCLVRILGPHRSHLPERKLEALKQVATTLGANQVMPAVAAMYVHRLARVSGSS